MTNPIKYAPTFYSYRDKLAILKELDNCKSNATVQRIMGSHNLTTYEIEEWRLAHENNGLNGLKITKRSLLH